MAGDVSRFLTDSLWLWIVSAAVLWGFLGFLLSSAHGLNIYAGWVVGAVCGPLGLLGLYLWARGTRSQKQTVQAVHSPTNPGVSSGSEWDDWSSPAERLARVSAQTPPIRATEAEGDDRRRFPGSLLKLSAVLAVTASVLLGASLLNEWLAVDISAVVSEDFYGRESLYTLVPILVSAVVVVGCLIIHARVGGRTPLAVAAVIGAWWFSAAVQLILSADALTRLAARVSEQQELIRAAQVEAATSPGLGLRLVAAAGLAAFCWALWVGIEEHRQERGGTAGTKHRAPQAIAAIDPSGGAASFPEGQNLQSGWNEW